MTMQPPDWDYVLEPWFPAPNEDPNQGPWITMDDAVESIRRIRTVVEGWVAPILVQLSQIQSQMPTGITVQYRGEAPDATMLPTTGNQIGDLWLDTSAREHAWMWNGRMWADFSLGRVAPMRFVGVHPDGAALPTGVPSPQDGDYALTQVDQHLWTYFNGRWNDMGTFAVTTPPAGQPAPVFPVPGGLDAGKVLTAMSPGVTEWHDTQTPTVTVSAAAGTGPTGYLPALTPRQGDAFVNTADAKLWLHDASGWAEVPTGSMFTVGNDVPTQHSFASTPSDGDHYWDSAHFNLYVFADSAWRDVMPDEVPSAATASVGQVLAVVDPTTNQLGWQDQARPVVTISATTGVDPSTYTPVLTPSAGDVFLNTADSKRWTYGDTGTGAQWVEESAAAVDMPVVTRAAEAPGAHTFSTAPKDGDWFLDTDSRTLYVRVSGSWADVTELPAVTVANAGQVPMVDQQGKVVWSALPAALPPTAGQQAGNILVVDDPTAGTTLWTAPPSELPQFGTGQAGQVLMVNPQGQVAWVTPPAAGAATSFKGTVGNAGSLPTTNVNLGDIYVTTDDGHLHVATAGSTPGPAAFSNIGPASGGSLPTAGAPNNGQMLMVVGGVPTWVAPPRELPPTNGKIAGDALAVTDPTTGAVDWQTAAGGGGVPVQPGQTPTGGSAALPQTGVQWFTNKAQPPTNTDGNNGDHWITTSGQHYVKNNGAWSLLQGSVTAANKIATAILTDLSEDKHASSLRWYSHLLDLESGYFFQVSGDREPLRVAAPPTTAPPAHPEEMHFAWDAVNNKLWFWRGTSAGSSQWTPVYSDKAAAFAGVVTLPPGTGATYWETDSNGAVAGASFVKNDAGVARSDGGSYTGVHNFVVSSTVSSQMVRDVDTGAIHIFVKTADNQNGGVWQDQTAALAGVTASGTVGTWHNYDTEADLQAAAGTVPDDDFAYVVATGKMYVHASGAWREINAGAAVGAGPKTYTGTTDPTAGQPAGVKDGDQYIRTDNGQIWEYAGGQWRA